MPCTDRSCINGRIPIRPFQGEELLERLGVGRAVALAAVGSDDLDNIAVSVAARRCRQDCGRVLRAGEHEAIAETRSLMPLGNIRDVPSLSATYVFARLIGLPAHGVVADGHQLFLELTAADSAALALTELPVSPRVSCRHVISAAVA